MVFASNIFIVFLVVALMIYVVATRRRPGVGKYLLIAISFIFYGWWRLSYLLILLASIGFNFAVFQLLTRMKSDRQRSVLVFSAIAANVLMLVYYKYFAFLLVNSNAAFQTGFDIPDIVLPLGISFFTFQQISFLIEAKSGRVKSLKFWDYTLFVSFFPQLIAGPIVRQSEMLPQISAKKRWIIRPGHFGLGFTLFAIGLFKKAFLIDPFVPHIDVLFDHAITAQAVSMLDGWTAAIGYSFQIYFDFSAYSDMALGLALIFGLRLPFNFFSPYKAVSFRDFWRRWHITLSHFLRDYIYVPLGGSRHGVPRTVLALIATMGIGGLWHGAGWQFLVWGLVHGALLSINAIWQRVRRSYQGLDGVLTRSGLYRALCICVVFALLAITWVYFRAADIGTANKIVAGMLGLTDAQSISNTGAGLFPLFPIYFAIVWFLPNTIQIMRRFPVALNATGIGLGGLAGFRGRFLAFRFNWIWSLGSVAMFVIAWFALSNLSPFIYFQF